MKKTGSVKSGRFQVCGLAWSLELKQKLLAGIANGIPDGGGRITGSIGTLLPQLARENLYQAVFFSLQAMQTDVHGTAVRRATLISSSQIVHMP